VIGGAVLNLLGVVSRPTQDRDILDPQLPAEVQEAARGFAVEVRARGEILQDNNWLNNGPAMLAKQLPGGWRAQLQPAFKSRALVLEALGWLDLLRSKLFALCDRGLDVGDCVALGPSAEELASVLP
jgi:hypothetical protein